MKLLTTIILVVMTFSVMGKTKFKLKPLPAWAKEAGRTQGGGWLWFPASYTDENRDLAAVLATGKAIDYLMSECGLPHKEIKFIEKFQRQLSRGGPWEFYLRAAIKDKHCRQGKNTKGDEARRKLTSPVLLNKFFAYRQYYEQNNMDRTICNKKNVGRCFEVADTAWRSKDYIRAAVYSKKACTLGYMNSCGFHGTVLWTLGQLGRARSYFTAACGAGFKLYCKFKKSLDKQIDSIAKN